MRAFSFCDYPPALLTNWVSACSSRLSLTAPGSAVARSYIKCGPKRPQKLILVQVAGDLRALHLRQRCAGIGGKHKDLEPVKCCYRSDFNREIPDLSCRAC